MLIDFTVENYRSIKGPVTLSAIAAPTRRVPASERRRRQTRPDSEIAEPLVAPGRGFSLLPVLGIFGANASGKSNVLRALDDVLHFLFWGQQVVSPGYDGYPYAPFCFGDSEDVPTRFQIRILDVDGIFTYELSLGKSRIVYERLDHLPSAPLQSRLLFERTWDEHSNAYTWKNGNTFKGPHTKTENGLSDQATYLNLLMKNLNVVSVMSVFEWIARQVTFSIRFESWDNFIALKTLYTEPELLRGVGAILRQFDTGITDVHIEARDGGREYGAFAYHSVGGEVVRLPFAEESAGTQRLLGIAYQVLVAIDKGSLLLRDELEAHLHPHITRSIVELFQSPATNPKRAQLIFTSHDHTLQSRQLLRRDQIWYTSKRADQSTQLYSLSEFKERSDRDIATSYIEGRYGAVPIVPPNEYLLPRGVPIEASA